jgi:hypothetical protein
MLVPWGSLKFPSKPNWRMRTLGGSRVEALVRRMCWRVFIRPPVIFEMWMSLALVRAHSLGKKVEMSFRASVVERRDVLSLVLVDDMDNIDRLEAVRPIALEVEGLYPIYLMCPRLEFYAAQAFWDISARRHVVSDSESRLMI